MDDKETGTEEEAGGGGGTWEGMSEGKRQHQNQFNEILKRGTSGHSTGLTEDSTVYF